MFSAVSLQWLHKFLVITMNKRKQKQVYMESVSLSDHDVFCQVCCVLVESKNDNPNLKGFIICINIESSRVGYIALCLSKIYITECTVFLMFKQKVSKIQEVLIVYQPDLNKHAVITVVYTWEDWNMKKISSHMILRIRHFSTYLQNLGFR